MFTKEELMNILNYSDIEYDMESSSPGIQYEDGRFEPYTEVQLPSEYFENYERNIVYPSVVVHTDALFTNSYSFVEDIHYNIGYTRNSRKNESLGFAA